MLLDAYMNGLLLAWLLVWPVAFILLGVIGLARWFFNNLHNRRS